MFSARGSAPPSCFVEERDRLVASASFRRLAGKTQVLAAPLDLSLRTRLTHSLEVAATARAIGARLGLDDALLETIALGHDIGHPAFGHAGERALSRLVPGGFHHAAHGVRVVTVLEPALALSSEVVDGILKHSKGKGGAVFARGTSLKRTSAESQVVRAADLLAYACHDIDDACRLGSLSLAEIPRPAARVLGADPESIRRTFIERTVQASLERGEVSVDPEAEASLGELRTFLYERLYESAALKRQTDLAHAIVERLWDLAREAPARWSRVLASFGIAAPIGEGPDRERITEDARARAFIDVFATLTDREALALSRRVRSSFANRAFPRSALRRAPDTHVTGVTPRVTLSNP